METQMSLEDTTTLKSQNIAKYDNITYILLRYYSRRTICNSMKKIYKTKQWFRV